MRNFRVFLILAILTISAGMLHAQHTIQTDDGAGHYSVLKSQTVDPLDVYLFPPGGGTLVTTPVPGNPALMWLTDGNTIALPHQIFGSLNAFDVIMEANGAEKMRLVSGGGVSMAANLSAIRGVPYVWPAANAAGLLNNDGSGNLTWTSTPVLALTNSHIFVGNAGNVATDVPMTGDISIANTGATAITHATATPGNDIVSALNFPATAKSLNADVLNYDATLQVTSHALGLNLGNANTWGGTQTFGAEALSPTNQVIANPGPVSNQAISASNTYFRVSAGAATSIDGIVSGGAAAAGRTITLSNVGANPITFINKTSSASAAANQFDLPGGGNIILASKGTITFIYDGTLLLWEVVSTN